jgi:hypothetical protein
MPLHTFVSPEAADALEKHVTGREIRDDEIEINVHALFHHLGCDEDAPGIVERTAPSETFEPVILQFGATLKGKPAVQESDADGIFTHRSGHGPKGLLCFDDGIANPEDALAGFGTGDEFVEGFLFGDDSRPQGDSPMRSPFRACVSAVAPGGAGRDQRVGDGSVRFSYLGQPAIRGV